MIITAYMYHIAITSAITLIVLWVFYRVNKPPKKSSPAYLLVFGLVQLGASLFLIQQYDEIYSDVELVQKLSAITSIYLLFTAGWFTANMVVKKGLETLNQPQLDKEEANSLLNM